MVTCGTPESLKNVVFSAFLYYNVIVFLCTKNGENRDGPNNARTGKMAGNFTEDQNRS